MFVVVFFKFKNCFLQNSSCKDLRVEYDSVCQRGATAQRNNGFCDGYERVCGGITASVDSKTVVSYKNTPTKGFTIYALS